MPDSDSFWDNILGRKKSPSPVQSPLQIQLGAVGLLQQKQYLAMLDATTRAVYVPPPTPTIGQSKPCCIEKFTPEAIAELKKQVPRRVGQRVPDSVEVITAWRAWRIASISGLLRLQSLGMENIWEPKKIAASECKGEFPNSHPAPAKSCVCGVWGFKCLDSLLEASREYAYKSVIGTVSMWGRVVECENGWRSQFAYPAELWMVDSEFEELGYIYGVPVRTL